jgi:MFS family permease
VVAEDAGQVSGPPPAARRRAFAGLFAGVAISTTGFLAVTTVASLVAEDLTGASTWSGLPSAAGVLGTAAGATLLARVVTRVGPRTGLALGYAFGTLATAVAVVAIVTRQFPLLVAALFAFGVGYGSNRLARYVAADLFPPELRATMIGWIVWASTIGAVAGPSLVAPSRELAGRFALPPLAGAFLVCLAASALSAAVMFASPRMDVHPRGRPAGTGPAPRLAALLRAPGSGLALAAMVSGQFVMVLVMTMTPVHIRHQGHGLAAIGLVISAHTLGMFAVSPVTGWLADRYGRRPLLAAGVVTLVTACLLGAAAGDGSYPLTLAALLLLGIGWNLGFVGGSALLTESVLPADRVRVQGLGDALIWGFGAVASASSGWILQQVGFAALSLTGAALALVPLGWYLRQERAARLPDGWPGARGADSCDV